MEKKIKDINKQIDSINKDYNGLHKIISVGKTIIITMTVLLFISILGNIFLGYIVISAGITVETTTETITTDDVNSLYHKNDTINNYGNTN